MKKLTKEEKIATTFAVIITFVLILIVSFSTDTGTTPKTISSATVSGGKSDRPIVTKQVIKNQEALTKFRVVDFTIGNGEKAKIGDTIYVHYVGQLEDGKVFDTSTNSSTPFSFKLGSGDVISGWDVGLVGMRVGGTRRLIIPPELGYGTKALLDSSGKIKIPANSTLIFDVVLMGIK